MFGNSPSSPSRDAEPGRATPGSTSSSRDKSPATGRSVPDGVGLPAPDVTAGEKKHEMSGSSSPTSRARDEGSPAPGEKKRRSGKASALLASAKNHFSGSSLSSGDKEAVQTPLQKLGKQDPALAVPQGANNNSAGESVPTARSTFRVGVTEDKNKKCRRTMEDTHSYLYNFLSTPAPDVSEVGSTGGRSTDEATSNLAPSSAAPTESSPSLASQGVVETDNGYFAIFDGHAGTFAADWCGKKLHIILEEAIRKNPNTPIPELLDHTFTSVDQQLEKLPVKNSGCTAVTAVLRWEDRIPNDKSATGSTAIAPATAAAVRVASDNLSTSDAERVGSTSPDRRPTSRVNSPPPEAASTSGSTVNSTQARLQEAAARRRVLYTANVGDARIVLCRGGKALRLSYDHKGSDENEGKRVTNAGGLILSNRVNGVLAVTRALGDAYMKDLVTGHPYTTETVIQADVDEFIILACDGLWDVCSDQEAVDLIRTVLDPQLASKMLVDHALARFSTDNLSCMVVRFDSKAVQNTVDRKNGAELIGVEGDPATLRGGVSEADAIVAEARLKVEEENGGPLKDEGTDDGALLDTVVKETKGEAGPEPSPTEVEGEAVGKQTTAG